MNSDTYQRLSLMRMSLVAFRRQVNEQLDAMDSEIAAMIPEDKVKHGTKHTAAQMRASLYALMPKTIKHRKVHVQ